MKQPGVTQGPTSTSLPPRSVAGGPGSHRGHQVAPPPPPPRARAAAGGSRCSRTAAGEGRAAAPSQPGSLSFTLNRTTVAPGRRGQDEAPGDGLTPPPPPPPPLGSGPHRVLYAPKPPPHRLHKHRAPPARPGNLTGGGGQPLWHPPALQGGLAGEGGGGGGGWWC